MRIGNSAIVSRDRQRLACDDPDQPGLAFDSSNCLGADWQFGYRVEGPTRLLWSNRFALKVPSKRLETTYLMTWRQCCVSLSKRFVECVRSSPRTIELEYDAMSNDCANESRRLESTTFKSSEGNAEGTQGMPDGSSLSRSSDRVPGRKRTEDRFES